MPDWPQVESKVSRRGLAIFLGLGLLFFALGLSGVFAFGTVIPPGEVPLGVARSAAAVFALLGAVAATGGVYGLLTPAYVQHAAADVLPQIPAEPVVWEGSVVHGTLRHELIEESDGWHLRPASRVLRAEMVFSLGLGIPLVALTLGLMIWVIRRKLDLGWLLFTTTVMLVAGGLALLLVSMLRRASHRRLGSLRIPRSGDSLDLDLPRSVDAKQRDDLAAGLKWAFLGETDWLRASIPRDLVVAVQLCPWRFVLNKTSIDAVQGVLVLQADRPATYHRLPLLLTADHVGAARLMQKLANRLNVPYLFAADAAGWKAEAQRARNRPPLRAGGILSS